MNDPTWDTRKNSLTAAHLIFSLDISITFMTLLCPQPALWSFLRLFQLPLHGLILRWLRNQVREP